ncbi:MAG TPA: hypothetical protein VMU81_08545 [Acetobacteraceae bacterium]|nr:hypothetical protein [Acetobacteraceae bacterium]
MKAVRAGLLAGAIVFALAGVTTALLVLRNHSATADATKIIQTTERMAVFPKLSDPASVTAEFDLPLKLSSTGRRQTRCPGRPVQTGQEWHAQNWWFTGPRDQNHHQPIFFLSLEDQPAVCPSDPLSALVRVLFMDVPGWRCIHAADLGDQAHLFNTVSRSLKYRLMRQDIARPDGSKARVELNFLGDDDDTSCLFSVTLVVRNA